jgi:hypothetical protein
VIQYSALVCGDVDDLKRPLNDSDITLDSFPNIIHRKDRSNSGGGLLIYSKNDISISRKSELENNLDETIWVEIRSKGQSFLFCYTYRSPCTYIDYWTRLTKGVFQLQLIYRNHSKRFQCTPFYF